MNVRTLHSARHLLHKATPKHIVGRHTTARTIRKFAESIGMIYFGYVDQQDDDHRLVRGITVSNTHDDHYYCVGTFKGYDMALTVRRDSLMYPDHRLKDHHWTIMTFDLHNKYELPHCYIGHHTAREELVARYSGLDPLSIYAYSAAHKKPFLDSYTVYARMTHAQVIAALFNPELTDIIGERFEDISIEISENTIYLYKAEKHPSRVLLERMTNNGLWLAEAIDRRLS